MITVLLAGNPTEAALGRFLFENLSKHYSVSYFSPKNYLQKGMGENLLLFEVGQVAECQLSPCIVVLKPNCAIEIEDCFEKNTVFILQSEQERYLKSLQRLNFRTITCGASQKDTVTFSSKSEDKIVISLQRPITNLTGENIEPMEIPLKRASLDEDFAWMAYASIQIEIGIIDKNLHS